MLLCVSLIGRPQTTFLKSMQHKTMSHGRRLGNHANTHGKNHMRAKHSNKQASVTVTNVTSFLTAVLFSTVDMQQ